MIGQEQAVSPAKRSKHPALMAVVLGAVLLTGCETTSAVFDGVGGVFMGAGHDVRRLGNR
ncbi:hypothetical protein [Roseinatronobacter sp. S2]|uniref:hypothetical protein n=1 Tax=Roseinatronobacter sp. S2 TaxID=3035471 RepID=UPI00240FEEE3|nr:hypothetical protein [Roseinatronobacter sp. S2]WFE75591.1 hypothetical protein P8S53_04040 [Roseinatronobacter sp. S2]